MLTLSDLTEDEKDYFQERAAILEYDGYFSRYEAERRAMDEVERKRKLF